MEAEPYFKSIVCLALKRDDRKCPIYVVFALLGCYAVLIGSYWHFRTAGQSKRLFQTSCN